MVESSKKRTPAGAAALRGPWLAPALILAGILANAAFAQAPGLSLQLPSQNLEVGESLDAELVCTNTGRPTPPQFVVPDGLDVSVVTPVPAQSSMTSMINGRTTQRVTYTYTIRIVGRKSGEYVLGRFSIEADGRTYSTEPIPIRVAETPASAAPDGDKLVFAKIDVAPDSLYVTQTFRATLTIGIRKVYLQNQLIDYEQLLQTIDARASNLSVFGPRFAPSEMTIADSTGKRHQYMIYRDIKELRAEEVGPLEIGPVFLRVNYPTGFRRSFFGMGLEPSRTTRETARAAGTTVEVKAPRAEGRPADFTGAIGRFTIAAAAKPERVQQGQPITLTITIQGAEVDGVAGPNLSLQPELLSRFDFSAEEMTGDVERAGFKVFRRAIFPRQPGPQTVPPISWSYFDPHAEEYVAVQTEPISIIVDDAAAGSVSGFTPATTEPAATGLTVLRGGVSPNYVDPRVLLADQSVSLSRPAILGVVIGPPLIWLALFVAGWRSSRLQADAGYLRRRRALRAGRHLAARAMREPTAQAQLQGLAEAMTAYLCDRFDLPPGALTPREARELVAARVNDSETGAAIADFLGECDAIRYAPATPMQLDPADARQRIRRWMTHIERNGR